MYLTPKCIILAIYTYVYIRIPFLHEMCNNILEKSNKIISQITIFLKRRMSYLLLMNSTGLIDSIYSDILICIQWSLLLGPGWKVVFDYLTKIGLVVKVTYTYIFCKLIINNQIRLFFCSYKNIYKSCPPGRINKLHFKQIFDNYYDGTHR